MRGSVCARLTAPWRARRVGRAAFPRRRHPGLPGSSDAVVPLEGGAGGGVDTDVGEQADQDEVVDPAPAQVRFEALVQERVEDGALGEHLFTRPGPDAVELGAPAALQALGLLAEQCVPAAPGGPLVDGVAEEAHEQDVEARRPGQLDGADTVRGGARRPLGSPG